MGLSRLENFLKNARGNILYVSPNDLDSTDSIENKGNSLTRPFKTIQRALIEASRFSYQRGLDNDRFGKTTILLYLIYFLIYLVNKVLYLYQKLGRHTMQIVLL